MEHGAKVAESKGMTVADHETIPPTTANFSPYATKLKAAGVDWVISWAPWVTQVKTFEALRQVGWQGKFISYAHNVAEEELKRIKDPGFLVFGANAMFISNQPIHKDIAAAAEGKTRFPNTYLNEGWIAASTLEAALKKVPWPPTRAKLVDAMNDLTVDMRGMRGGPIVWTKDNHYRPDMYYRVYAWDSTKNAITIVKDWVRKDLK
jgi:ABC-type branched-subunit amino acid transport system substrate-binding protein